MSSFSLILELHISELMDLMYLVRTNYDEKLIRQPKKRKSMQFGYAGMNVISKVSLNGGMSHYVLVVYRHAFATAAIAPFALIFERKARPKITFMVFMQIFVLGLLGPVIDQNFYYLGLKYTSPTFSCAMSNMLPAMTFVMAAIFRMEKLDLKTVRCQAKVIGTAVTVAGAMLMTLYKGPIMELFWTKHIHAPTSDHSASADGNKDWVKGSILLIFATLAWAAFFILQAVTLRKYKNHGLTLISMVVFVGTVQATVVTFVMERKASVWRIGWDMDLLAAAYAGIVSSSLPYYVQGLVMKTKGPVFVTAFSPLMMIIVAIMDSFILAENIYLGGMLGSVLIVAGLYSVLWGKHKEQAAKEQILDDHHQILPETIKQQQLDPTPQANCNVLPVVSDMNEANSNSDHNSTIVDVANADGHEKDEAARTHGDIRPSPFNVLSQDHSSMRS